MSKIIKFIYYFKFFFFHIAYADNHDFEIWLKNFKNKAISSGISKNVVDDVMSDAKFLPKVIEYDRFQPEFYEDTYTYINKRTSKKKVNEGLRLYKKEKKLSIKLKKNLKLKKNFY